MYPNLIIPGSPKCGSSTLHHYLNTHPEIQMSALKEPSIYLNQWGHDAVFYKQFFTSEKDKPKIYGESTIAYLTYPEIPQRIQQVAPNTKFIFVLRDPVLRTYSHYWHRVKGGNEQRTWEDALKASEKEYLFDYSFYYKHLQAFLKYFPISQMHFIVLEEFQGNEAYEMSKVFQFLDLKDFQAENAQKMVNRGYQPKSRSMNNWMLQFKKQRKWARLVPNFTKPIIHRFLQLLSKSNKKDYTYNQLTPDHVTYLTGMYRQDVASLENLLGRKLPWLGDYETIVKPKT